MEGKINKFMPGIIHDYWWEAGAVVIVSRVYGSRADENENNKYRNPSIMWWGLSRENKRASPRVIEWHLTLPGREVSGF